MTRRPRPPAAAALAAGAAGAAPEAGAAGPVLGSDRLPAHIAIIMDGNGRWAQRQGLPRSAGHRAGVRPVREVVETCGELGIRALTLYAFSTENWKRPRPEVDLLMTLCIEVLDREVAELHAKGVRLRGIGRRAGLPAGVREALERAETLTAANTGLQLVLALNYGGRQEIVDAARRLAAEVQAGRLGPGDIDEARFAGAMDTAGLPEPDLLIRCGGEMRLSNFLLWESAYSELLVTSVHWPDFGRADLLAAVAEFQRRQRRFGGLGGPGDRRA
jgi:undecaprenyl diphosphate synthase